ncbi:hypothetical protein GCM10017576_08460 [Microbacterium barkeri]|uniref:Polysaccharide pyruvyl transferase domain-containing protein n=1 Tax=Microbacterium barkeri TaxID=33917 RepID=A0A9W6LVV0_9MICO|nr:polysaccharide pyruvyl transferase family protein [Microbacterium barkeri]MDI6942717.1 polysaccharide pyruvyl transferase family protein [Microbacterium barkeri]MDR6875123.1 polysaccharide pyruvyl transferase WcaK-like protein [Microbacterium barkeri]GLJ60717.1 hypothetical protein GCM10017576_08460 [Microbacterium barkeri]
MVTKDGRDSLARMRFLLGLLLRRSDRRHAARKIHVLLAAPGRGNIGDAAMLEAFAAAVGEEFTVITRHPDDYRTLPANAKVVSLPRLIYGSSLKAVLDIVKLARVLNSATNLSIVGADIMDGAYNAKASTRRSLIAARAAAAGLDVRILGFSWNGQPDAAAESELRAASEHGVRLLARDGSSSARLRAAGMSNVTDVADIVFTSSSLSDAPVVPGGGPYAVINASGLVARSVDQTAAYVSVIERLHEQGIGTVLLPHVVRAEGDPAQLALIHERLSPQARERSLLITEELEPAQVRALAAGAEFVVTGRMHLSVMSLRQGVPAVVVATQGKVEGLMELFDISDLLVAPSAIPEGGLLAAVTRLLTERDDARARIARWLPRAIELAERNFEGMPTAAHH